MKFNIEGTIYKTRNLKDISLNDYNEIFNFLEAEKDEIVISKSLMSIFTDIPFKIIDNLKDSDLLLIDWKLKLLEPLKGNSIKESYLGYDLDRLDNMTLGKYIDLDEFITSDISDKMQKVVALMLAPSDYTLESIEMIAKEIEVDMNTGDALVLFQHFADWRLDIVEKYEPLFEAPIEDEDEEPKDKAVNYGWLGVVYSLCNNDITKKDKIIAMNFISVLNYMGYDKSIRDTTII